MTFTLTSSQIMHAAGAAMVYWAYQPEGVALVVESDARAMAWRVLGFGFYLGGNFIKGSKHGTEN